MQTIRRNGGWAVASLCALALGASAVIVNDRLLAEKHEAPQLPRTTDARDLSTVFRQVSKEALPCIVSIEASGKTMHAGQNNVPEQFGDMFGENSPFGEFFKNNPQYKEFKNHKPHAMPRSHGTGSGFIIDASGVIVTNTHVVKDADQVKVKLQDGTEYVATDVKMDPRTDVAIVRIKPEGKLHALSLGDSDATEIGDWVLAVGSPFGLDFSVTSGIVSAKGRGMGIADREDFIQTDAAINPGNSGGPLLNLNGEVIGVNTAISSRGGGNDGVGFAIPINMVKWVSQQLMEKGSVSRVYLGVGIQEINNDLAKQLNLPVGQGALVTVVAPHSPAGDLKLEPGDVIVKLAGKMVGNTRSLQGIVEQLQLGHKYPLEIQRDGKLVSLEIGVKEMPKDFTRASFGGEGTPEEQAKPESNSFNELGFDVQELTPEIAKKLGFKENVTGVVISAVKEDGPAAANGMTEGMVISKVGNHRVTTTADFKAALKDATAEKGVPGVLLRVSSPEGSRFVVLKK